jgi:hypothetical protein
LQTQNPSYAKASYKPRIPETKSFGMLIADDKRELLSEKPDLTIVEIGELTTGDNQKLRAFTFFPRFKGEGELVSYGEEGEFYLIFTLSSHSKEGFDKAKDTYRELIAPYKAQP